ncbi:MAG: CBS domain-containing protein, partial [Candidatus Bathyarchaeota archaeon]|nr:CBS domain-containing protein [Candidatus Bathyarchaeota archaeon]
MSLKVEDAMIRDVIAVDATSTVKEAVEIMNEHEIGCLVVIENHRLIGILTERDVLKRVLAATKDPKKTKVGEIMTTRVFTVSPETDLEEAARLMFENDVKKLPV